MINMSLFRRKEVETDVKTSKEYSMLESFVKEFEIGFGEKFYRSSLFGDTPFFDSESKKLGLLPADIHQVINQLRLERILNPSDLKRKTIGDTEVIGAEGGSWIDFNVYERLVKTLEKMGVQDYRILMSTEQNNPVVVSTLKFNIIIPPIV
ncbi:MAG: hypothetical protein KJ655_03775 [Candidatus Thermoplasmatota archaeon]|nr:hypothetical protein [Candidatus Thermoplasmatota archaeon]